MAYIRTGNRFPGILGLLWYKHSPARALGALAHSAMRKKRGLTPGERELIATYVSNLNGCSFCTDSHAATAACYLSDEALIENVKQDPARAKISQKMKSLLNIAGKVQKSGKEVLPSDIEESKRAGASDEDIHDTVLIAAMFCMFNRYVDGLGTVVARKSDYPEMGKMLVKFGYKQPPFFLRWLVRRQLEKTNAL